jgi:hypothetical protein
MVLPSKPCLTTSGAPHSINCRSEQSRYCNYNHPNLTAEVPIYLIMPYVLVGFSSGAAGTDPPTMWFRSVSLPSDFKRACNHAKLAEFIGPYISAHHTGSRLGDLSGLRFSVQSISISWQEVKPLVVGAIANTPLTGLYDECVIENLELMEQRGWKDYLFVVYEDKAHPKVD